jgi:hypothetical protein
MSAEAARTAESLSEDSTPDETPVAKDRLWATRKILRFAAMLIAVRDASSATVAETQARSRQLRQGQTR